MKPMIFRKLALTALMASAVAVLGGQVEEYRTLLTPDGRGIVRRPGPLRFQGNAQSGLPTYDPAKKDTWQVDLRGCDLRSFDLNGRLPDLRMAHFDDRTLWPAALPAGFEPKRFMELGRNPGLGIRSLHARGLTGRGVGIGIIDQGLLVDHEEYRDRLRLYEEIHCGDETAPMHGAAVASIAAGQTVGVAPGADLYYIAETHGTFRPDGFAWDFTHLARSIDRLLEINRGLPAPGKIRVISISVAWNPDRKGYAEVNEAVARARRENVFVASVSMRETYGFDLTVLGRDPLADPDAPASYGPPWWGAVATTGLGFPMDSRVTASATGPDEYVFYRLGGISWAAPWAAGLYALACQVAPEVTPDIFWAAALETAGSVEVAPDKPSPSEAELRERVGKLLDDTIARLRAQDPAGDPEEALARLCSQVTGRKLSRMSEADFRTAMEDRARDHVLSESRPLRLRVVNPAGLIEALEKRF